LGRALAALFSDATIEAVVSPALGGLVIGTKSRVLYRAEIGAQPHGRRSRNFAERDSGGMMCLRRGFSLRPDQVFVIEDVWTTGGATSRPFKL